MELSNLPDNRVFQHLVGNNKGGALPLVIGLLAVMTLLGIFGVRMAIEEVSVSGIQKGSIQVRYLAESGLGILVQWFQEPQRFPGLGEYPFGGTVEDPARFLSRRMVNARGTPSFFDLYNISQFQGTRDNPDFLYRAEDPSGEIPGPDWSESGIISELRIYRPVSPGALCTIEATAKNFKGARHTLEAQLVPAPLLPTSAAFQFATGIGGPIPLKVHWGDIRIVGDADLGASLQKLPVKDPFAPVDGDAYEETGRKDRWIDIEIGGRIINPKPKNCVGCSRPFAEEGHSNVVQGLEAVNPGWGIDPWNYSRLKRFAHEWGTYYRTDADGFVYSGEGAAALRLRPVEALEAAQGRGSGRPFVFIDTLDGLPPNGQNLATLHLPVHYLRGFYAIQAHVVLSVAGTGRVVEARTPVPEGTENYAARQDISLERIHIDGIFSVAGNLEINGNLRMYGVLRVEGEVMGPGEPELWFNADLATGYFPGLPTVMIKKGSWYYR